MFNFSHGMREIFSIHTRRKSPKAMWPVFFSLFIFVFCQIKLESEAISRTKRPPPTQPVGADAYNCQLLRFIVFMSKPKKKKMSRSDGVNYISVQLSTYAYPTIPKRYCTHFSAQGPLVVRALIQVYL